MSPATNFDSLASAIAHSCVCGDAAELPIRSSSLSPVTAFWISTDVEDFGQVLCEVARVLEPEGRLYLRGVHPCFNGPFVEPGGSRQRDGAVGASMAERCWITPLSAVEGHAERAG